MDHRPSVERSGAGADGRHGFGIMDGEDGVGYRDTGGRLGLIVAEAG